MTARGELHRLEPGLVFAFAQYFDFILDSVTLSLMRRRYVVEVLDEKDQSSVPSSLPFDPQSAVPSASDPLHTPVQTSVLTESPGDEAVSVRRRGWQIEVEEEVSPRAPLKKNEKPRPLGEKSEVAFRQRSAPTESEVRKNADSLDMFSRHHDQVDAMLRETQLKDSQEIPRILAPRSAKRVSEQEIAHLDVTRHSVIPEESHLKKHKIERYFLQSGGEPPKKRLTPDELNDSSIRKVRKFVPVGKSRVGVIVLGLVGLLTIGTIIGGGYYLHQDVLSTQALAIDLLESIESGHLTSAREQLIKLEKKRDYYVRWYQSLRPVAAPLLGEEKVTHLDQLVSLSGRGVEVLERGFTTYDTVEKGYKQFTGQTEGKTLETMSQVPGQLESLFTDLASFQADVSQLDNPFETESIPELQKRVTTAFPDIRRGILAAQQVNYALPELLGENGKRQYLVLLQNNAELRPTGGFIGSFGILTVEKGRFIDFRVEDVYEADGQLNGFVAPPAEIRDYLGEAQWYLRDVNWSPDFPTVSQQASWFLDKTIGVEPDGVIAINLEVARKLLEVTGPIELVDYGEIVTKDNLYERAQTHSEINFFPGSTQKRDYLSAVANALFDKLLKSDANKMQLLQALYHSAEESQLLIALDQPQSAQAFSALGWDGAVRTPECPQPFASKTCFVDSVMQVEANVGVNKANQFIKRTISQSTKIEGQMAHHLRQVNLTNSSQSNAWPQGAYKAYFRLLLPLNASVNSVSINGVNLNSGELRYGSEVGKQSVGFLAHVPVLSSAEIVVDYSVPLPEGVGAYALFEQKQPGTAGDQITHEIEVVGRPVLTVAPEPKISGNILKFSSERTTHEFMAVEF